MSDKILFVDDEPAVLDGYKRMLYRDFDVQTAEGGDLGLEKIRQSGPYAVVVSDMRMPGMSGTQFLTRVRETSADTVRMLLTGFADVNSAMEAVNEGNIFRFLTKPCQKDILSKALTAGIVQYRLVKAEKDLLENTLMGSIKVLTDVLSAVSPETFGRSLRITRCMRHLVAQLGLSSRWRFEAAAMLSQLGCLTVDPEIMRAAYLGTEMPKEHKALFEAHPRAARDLLMSIPRLEPIAWMISQQLEHETKPSVPKSGDGLDSDIVIGAKILRLSIAFDSLRMQGLNTAEAIQKLEGRASEFGPQLVRALRDMKSDDAAMEIQKVAVSRLVTGMILQQDIRAKNGMLVVGKGQEVTRALLLKLENFAQLRTIEKEVLVSTHTRNC
jgi:response regulator RpfG family c-di-GMP phosphodiesterase